MAEQRHAYEDIDEAEEEALLKSDDEYDATKGGRKGILLSASDSGALLADDDSLMQEAAQLQQTDGNAADGRSVNADSDDSIVLAGAIAAAGSSDDASDSDAYDDEVNKALSEYKQLLKELEQNHYAYDKYVRLCEVAHATDELENIRNAYNLFSAAYPLTPELWCKYLSTELWVHEVAKVLALFRRALADYYSLDVAAEYIKFAERTNEPENIWREVLGTYGLHCLRGRELYQQYREFLDAQPNLSGDSKQTLCVQSWLRELHYPLLDMEESYIELKVYHERHMDKVAALIDWPTLDAAYYKAKEQLQLILPYEQQLQRTDAKAYTERAAIYTAYIKATDGLIDENVLQTIYERMVADCCLSVECWRRYVAFVAYRDEDGVPQELLPLPLFQQSALDVSARALRNCTWAEKLYVQRMQLLEKRGASREQVQEVLEGSMTAGFQTPEPAVTIWLEYLTYLRRHTNWAEENDCEILRKNFNLAWTILGQQWGVLADCNCEILQLWGRLEYGPLQDAQRGRELWSTVMESADNATKSGLWIEFAQLEMRRDLESTRRLFHKAIHTPSVDNALVLVSAWERFERCNGTLKSLIACLKECDDFRATYAAQCAAAVEPSAARHKATEKSKGDNRKRLNASAKSVATADDADKCGPTPAKQSKAHHDVPSTKEASGGSSSSNYKQHEHEQIDMAKDHLRIFLSNLDYNLSADELRDSLAELNVVRVDLVRSANGRSRGFGYLELQSAADVERALAMDRRTLHGRPLFVSSVLRDKEQRQKFKYSSGVEPKKVFVKGLPPDASKEELNELFQPFGAVHEVRLVHHKSGKFKNIAYVEYKEESSASRAVQMLDQTELRGHTLNLAISAPPPPKSAQTAAAPVTKLLANSMKRKRTNEQQQRPRMSLIPNVVRKKLGPPATVTATATTTNGSSNSATPSTGKSNADFRRLLLQ